MVNAGTNDRSFVLDATSNTPSNHGPLIHTRTRNHNGVTAR